MWFYPYLIRCILSITAHINTYHYNYESNLMKTLVH